MSCSSFLRMLEIASFPSSQNEKLSWPPTRRFQTRNTFNKQVTNVEHQHSLSLSTLQNIPKHLLSHFPYQPPQAPHRDHRPSAWRRRRLRLGRGRLVQLPQGAPPPGLRTHGGDLVPVPVESLDFWIRECLLVNIFVSINYRKSYYICCTLFYYWDCLEYLFVLVCWSWLS